MILLDVLDKYIFSGVPSNAVWDLIKTTWERANRKSWEDLYLDAFQAALDEARPLLAAYTREGEVALDRLALSEALHHDLGTDVEALPFSKLSDAEFVAELAAAMEVRSTLIIGGHNLSRGHYFELVLKLIRNANSLFKRAVLADKLAFRHALLDEALGHQVLIQEVQAYMAKQFGLTLAELDVIESKVDAQTGLMQQVTADVREIMQPLEKLDVIASGVDVQSGLMQKVVADLQAIKKRQPETVAPPEPLHPPEVQEFVGREAELAYFADKLATTHLALIAGMPGVGKTALAAMLAARTSEPEKIFWHSFHEAGGVNVLIWKLAGFLAWHGQEHLWQMLSAGSQPPPPAVLLAYVFPMLQGRGYLLWLDDLQNAEDDPLLDLFLNQLNEALKAGEVVCIITSRHRPEFAFSGEFEPLKGLSRDDARSLLDRWGVMLADDLFDVLYDRTEGNAQLLTLAIHALTCGQEATRLIGQLAESADVERFLMHEVDDCLDNEQRDVMSAVAVLGEERGTSDAISAILDGRSVRRTLTDLCDHFLLNVVDGAAGKEYGQHAMVLAFYYDVLLSKRERQTMHLRAGQYYEIEESDTLKASRHLQLAGEYDRAARLATTNVWAIINQGQAQTLRQLLELFNEQQMDNIQWALVNLARGQVYVLLGETQLARESYQLAHSLLTGLPDSPSTRELIARACRGVGESLQYESPQDALVWLHRGLDELAAVSGPEEAALHIDIGRVQIGRSEYAAALSALEQGLSLLPEGPSQWRASALGNMGLILCAQGHIEQGKELYRRALEISEQLHDYWRIVAWRHNLGIEMETAGDWQGASVEYREASELAERLGSISHQTELTLSLGILYTKQGNIEDAVACLARCIELARRHDLNEHLVHGLSSLADLRVRLGEWDVAEGLLNEAEQLSSRIGTKYQLPEIYRGCAQVRFAQGQMQAAMDYAERSIALARELDLDIDEGMSLRVLGLALHANRQQEQTVVAFEKGLSILAERDPYEAARTKVEWAKCFKAMGDTERGLALMREAQATFRKLGARRDLADVERLLS